MKLVTASRRLGLDTVSDTSAYADLLWNLGVRTVFRYINRQVGDGGLPSWLCQLSQGELDLLIGRGFTVSPVQFGIGGRADRTPDHAPAVGAAAVQHCQALGLPKGITIWCDCEWSEKKVPKKADQVQYLNAWSKAVVDGSYRAGLYVSPDLSLSGQELYDLPHFTAYWKSASGVPMVEQRGYQVTQTLEYVATEAGGGGCLVPFEGRKRVKGLRCDLDVLAMDGKGSYLAACGK